VQIVKFYYALKQSKNPTMDGEPIEFWWEDDESLRVTSDVDSILIFKTDRIKEDGTTIVVSIGAKDYEFKL
jgi:hypothetical protein